MISLTPLLLAQPSTLNLNQTPIVSRQNGGRLSNTRQYAIDCRSGMSCSVDGGVLLISSSGSTSAPVDATYLTQTANATLTNEQALSALGTGLMSNTTGTGVVSIYGGSACGANQYASSVNASGTLICAQVATSQLSGTITDGQLASSYSGVGACAANTFATTLSDNAAPTCSAVNDATGALKGGVVLAGDLAGTASLPSVVDDSHAHTGTTISALDTGDITTGTLGQARGGTGAGALTCSAGDFLTSNGTAYSCGTPTAGAPTGASYITRVAEAGLSSETAMGALGTGIVINTTTTGVPTIYAGTSCTNQFPRSLNASGAATCASVALGTDVSGTLGAGNGGLGITAVTDDTTVVASGAAWVSTALPSCSGATNALAYNTSTNAFSCNTISGGSGYATIQDETTPLTQRATVNFTGAGVSCVDNSGSSRTDCTISGGSGSVNVVEVEVDFGTTGSDIATTVVTGQTWVGATSKIICSPTLLATADRAEGAEEALVENLLVAPHTRVAGTGFSLTAKPLLGRAYGRFLFHCTGA